MLDLTMTDEYRELMEPLVEDYRAVLEDIDFDVESDFELCAWLLWHWETDE